jgi:hypothetical protein
MSTPINSVTHVEVIDYLAQPSPLTGAERAANYRFRERLKQIPCGAFISCQICGCDNPLTTKRGTPRWTEDVVKAICNDCKVIKETRKKESTRSHPRLKSFTFSDGSTIKMCPDCTTFDAKRRKAMWDKSPWRKAVSGGTGSTVNNIGSGPVGPLFKVDRSQYVVVPAPSTKVVGPLPEWQIDRDERDHDSFACVYVFKIRWILKRKLTDEDRINGFANKRIGIGFAPSDEQVMLEMMSGTPNTNWCPDCKEYVWHNHEHEKQEKEKQL